MISTSISQASTFRDPAGSVSLTRKAVFRTVLPAHAGETLDFLASPVAAKLSDEGRLISSTVLRSDADGLLLQHPRVPFISYPTVGPPPHWSAAAELTLDLCTELVEHGWILKDATPLNVLFRGTEPIFVDLLSIRRMDPTQPIWFAYGQFIRTFLLPLLAHKQLGWRLSTAQTSRDGIEPEELYTALSWSRRLLYPARNFITLPILLGRVTKSAPNGLRPQRIADHDVTRGTLLKTLHSLRKALARTAPRPRPSTWSTYTDTSGHYSDSDHDGKRSFVAEALAQCIPKKVLDVGSNTGNYSRLAAESGADVVAIDSDLGALDRLCSRSCNLRTGSILPLAVDLSFPTPSTGWNNGETLSFLDRAEGYFDAVLMLAVIHHLLLSSQIPLDLIAELCARITTRTLIIEWVPPTDPKFIEILRGREAIYTQLTEAAFRQAFAPFFAVERELTLGNARILFHMSKREPGSR